MVAFVALLHPGYAQPVWVTGVVAAVGLLIAGAVQLYDVITHHLVTFACAIKGTADTELPSWLTATWLNQVISTFVTGVVGIVALLHPGFHESVYVKAALSSLAGVLVVLIPFINQVLKSKVAALR